MRKPCGVVLLVLVALVAISGANVLSGNSVFILSNLNLQPVTSSTLHWVSESDGRRPLSSVVATDEILPGENAERDPDTGAIDEDKLDAVTRKPVLVCRARQNGVLVPGQLIVERGACQVSLHGAVASFAKYEVLENIERAARLTWVRWDRWSPSLPAGAVSASQDTFIARRLAARPNDATHTQLGRRHFVGKLLKHEFGGHLTIINATGQEEEVEDGEILVETEPIRYELAIQSFTLRRKKSQQTTKALGETTLKNSGSSPMKVDAVIGYEEQYSLYWGQGKALLRGLPTTIRLPDGTIFENIQWGVPENEERKNLYRVEAYLEPGTAVNVSLSGNHTITELPYIGNLVALFEDGASGKRAIHGTRREVSMKGLVATYGPAYFLGNHTLVPTTTTTTTTTTSTTTTTPPPTTTTTSTTPTPPQNKPKKDEHRKEENMINDQAQSLKEGARSAAEVHSSSPAASLQPLAAALACSCLTALLIRIT